jgi:pyrroline-5-carboxylate reductase
MNAVTAVSGSGPAYFFLLMEVMEKSALELGLSQHTAQLLIEQTALGAARIALKNHLPPTAKENVKPPLEYKKPSWCVGLVQNRHDIADKLLTYC